MTEEQFKRAKILLEQRNTMKKERDGFIGSIDSEFTSYTHLDEDITVKLMQIVTEHYNTKIAALEEEFNNI